MGVFDKDDKESMTYMHEVDVAMNRSGHPWAFTLTLSVFVFFIVFFLWASGAMIDDVTRGMGQIIPAQGIQPIQSERGGTITEVFVEENEQVEKNQILLSISNVQAVAGLKDQQTRATELTLMLKRLNAEEKGIPLSFTPQEEEMSPDAVRAQNRLFLTRKEQFDGQEQLLRSQLEQRKKEVTENTERRDSLERQLSVLKQQEETFGRLYRQSGSVSRLQFIEIQQRVVAMEGDLASTKQSIAKASSGVQAAEERLSNLSAERQASIADEINKTRSELSGIEQQIMASDEQVTRTELRSPVRGAVKRIILKKDSVAKPAETIMEILPTDGALEVEAKFSPQDRGFLFVNQPAMVKVTAYDFSIYGGLEATVTKISNDTIEDKKGEPWYEVRFVTKRKSILYRGEELEILPGMTVSVDVLTDKKSVLSHIIGPIRKAMQNAMTEH